jgi:D-3-phosphoglycerate dehydrogenase
VRNAAIQGVLAHSEVVNRINAASIAQERGIRIHEEKNGAAIGGAGSVLKISLHSNTARRPPARRCCTATLRAC